MTSRGLALERYQSCASLLVSSSRVEEEVEVEGAVAVAIGV